jgi:hypothetical protein
VAAAVTGSLVEASEPCSTSGEGQGRKEIAPKGYRHIQAPLDRRNYLLCAFWICKINRIG